MTVLSGDELLVEVRLALKAEGCCAEVEIVRLLGAAPGQRNWEIATIGPNTAAPDVRSASLTFKPGSARNFSYGHGGELNTPGFFASSTISTLIIWMIL